jgi:hypothetical protein
VRSHAFVFALEGECTFVGEYHPAGRPQNTVTIHVTDDRAQAKLWQAALRDGHLPAWNERITPDSDMSE